MQTETLTQNTSKVQQTTYHNLAQLKNYPTVHRWIVNRTVFSITANRNICLGDIIVFGANKFLVLGNYKGKMPRPAINESVNDKNLMFVTEDSKYFELETQQL